MMLKKLTLFSVLFTFVFAKGTSVLAANPSWEKFTFCSKDSNAVVTNDTTQKVVVDTLKPIFVPVKYDSVSSLVLLDKKEIDRSDYRFLGDLVNYLPFGFLERLGSIGVPVEARILGFGLGYYSISLDGVDITDPSVNSFNFYTLRSEYISTLEIPLPTKAFLFSDYNNPVVINFSSFDKIASKPYSRIRYYQAPNDEGSIDGFFNIYPFKRLNVYGGFQNASVASNYLNSEYGLWNATLKFRYLMNNTFNFIFAYNYSDSKIGLNGGVDFDYLKANNSPSEAERILYSPFEAPVKFRDRYQKVTNNVLNLKTLIRINERNTAEVNVYYYLHLKQFRQDEKSVNRIYQNDRSKKYGVSFTLPFEYKGFDVTVGGSALNTSLILNSLSLEKNLSLYSLFEDAKITMLNGLLGANVFSKYSYYDGKQSVGIGSQLNLKVFRGLSLTMGASKFNRIKHIEEYVLPKVNNNNEKSTRIFFAKLVYSGKLGRVEASFFNTKGNSNTYWVERDSAISLNLKDRYLLYYVDEERSGVNFSFSSKLYNILFSSNFSYYFYFSNELVETPKFTLWSGLYYVDTLFNSNLKLKAGVNFYANTPQSFRKYEFQFDRTLFYSYNDSKGVSPYSNQLTGNTISLDLFFAGTIQDRATLYLTLENVLDRKQFIVPYYPLPGITFRFGVAWEFIN